MSDLIYDIGLHDGEDSAFYLLKGFRVIAVEADPELCRAAAERLREFVGTGQLIIVNRAIAPERGPVTFFRTTVSGWGTIIPEWRSDVAARGVASEPVLVEGITLADLVADHGDAFYMKLDIEGMDRRALESLEPTTIRPDYLSIETTFSRSPTFAAVEADFAMLERLGYDRFKVIDQYSVALQVPPSPAMAGRFVPFRFVEGASGLFGDETPGHWQSGDATLAAFRRTLRPKWLQRRLYPNARIYSYYCAIMRHLTGKPPNLGWFDIHAKHSSVG